MSIANGPRTDRIEVSLLASEGPHQVGYLVTELDGRPLDAQTILDGISDMVLLQFGGADFKTVHDTVYDGDDTQ